ncbi:hypothetical protein ACROYT_G003990 [Oculina patagonica]
MRKYVLKNVPKSSKLYHIIQTPSLRKRVAFANGKRISEGNEFTVTEKYPLRNGCKILPSRNKLVYKNVNHRINNIVSKLSGDIETNPGPFVVDPTKTIHAPYSQGNSSVFGSNAGNQCVAMSLTAILYSFIYSVRSSSDLVEIMTIGNELYTHLSTSVAQDRLMLTELPEVLCLRETMYSMRYSDSYFGTVHNLYDCATEDVHCRPLLDAFDLLIGENFKSFILTITISTVAIFITKDGTFKVFDSHSRDSKGMSDPCGTCVLIEIASLDHLVQYFKNLHILIKDALYELKGVQILTEVTEGVSITTPEISGPVQFENLSKTEIGQESVRNSDTYCSCKQCCFICFYAICFSVLKQISYWNENTFDAIIENCNRLQEKLMLKEHCTASDLPNSLAIDIAIIEAHLSVAYKIRKTEQQSLCFIQEMKKVIAENQEHNTGFLMSALKCYVCCIFKRDCKGNTCYNLFGLNNSKLKGHDYEKVKNITSAIELLLRMIADKTTLDVKAYEIHFVKCNCELSSKDRQTVLRRHVSAKQKQKLAKDRRESYAAMEPAKKRACLDYYASKLLYRKTVVEFKKDKYDSSCCLFTSVKSFNEKMYICNTCHNTIKKKNKTPCQAVHNNLGVDEVPRELAVLEKLEQILISQRIVFQKLIVMPKGQQRKIKGAICNVPVTCEETCKVLPRPPDSTGIIMLKLKRKLQFRGHVYFQAVRPQLIMHALNWLKSNNELYENVTINLENIDPELSFFCAHQEQNRSNTTNCSQNGTVSPSDIYDDSGDNCEREHSLNEHAGSENANNDQSTPFTSEDKSEDDADDCDKEDPINEHRAATCETCLQSIIPDYPIISDEQGRTTSAGNEIFDIAPGENKHPVSIMTDRYCEELAFPVLFPKGRYGY